MKTLETEIIVLFRQVTGLRTKVVFNPAGWFVEQLEKDVIAAITPLKNPFAKVKDMTPPAMYELAKVYDPSDRTKVFDCRALCRRAHCCPRANRGQIFGAAICHFTAPRITEGFS